MLKVTGNDVAGMFTLFEIDEIIERLLMRDFEALSRALVLDQQHAGPE